MIVKGDRVATIASARRVIDHLFRGAENEAIEVLQGGERDLLDAWKDARTHSAPKALRVWILAPREEITREQAMEILASIAEEFRFDLKRATIVEHRKSRVDPGAFNRHWHMAVGEVDPVTGRVLSSSHDHARHEFIARLWEARLHHAFTIGAHTKAVLARLRREGNTAVADALDAAFTAQDVDRPREAFTTARHQAAKRGGVDLPAMREVVGAAWKSSNSLAGLTVALEAAGLSLSSGDVEGEWIVTQEGTLLGSLRRLTKLRKAAFAERMKGLIHADAHAHQTGRKADRPDDPGRGRGHEARDPGASDVRGNARGADGGRTGELHVRRVDAAQPDSGRDRADAREPAGATPGDDGTRLHRRAEGGDERRLIASEMSGRVRAVSQLVQRAEAVATPALYAAQSHINRCRAIELTTSKALPAITDPRLAEMAAEIELRQQEDNALGEVDLRLSQETARLISEKWKRENSFWARWSKPIDYDGDIQRLRSERMTIESKRSKVQRELRKVTLAEQSLRDEHKKARATASAEHAQTSKIFKLRIAVYGRALKLLNEWPALAHCGLRRVLAMASRVEKMREKGWDPGPQVNDLRPH